MQAEATTYNYFSVDGATTQTLSNSVANKLKTGFTKAVFVDVSHHLALNKAAIKQAEDDSMNLPSESCSRYIERREKFTKVVDGLTKYLVDGVEFNKIVGLLSSDQASTHSICSPERYPSDKLDYLVEDAQLEFKDVNYTHSNGIQALNEINLIIKPKTINAIVGSNGTGKTTLARHINGLLKPTSAVPFDCTSAFGVLIKPV